MKALEILFVLAIAALTIQCISPTATAQISKIKNTDTSISKLKERPTSPVIKIKREFRISEKGAEPILLEESTYNDNGKVMTTKEYDYYGSGREEGNTTHTYSEESNLMSTVQNSDGQMITYTFEYNDKNQKTAETWKRKNGQGDRMEFLYNEQGNVLEERHITLQGKLDFSRVYEYEYDANGKILSEKKWEKYTDGDADLLQYHLVNKYENNQLVSQIGMTENGKPRRMEVYVYDANGLKIEQLDASRSGVSKNVIQYNEYGEAIDNKTYRVLEDESEILDIHSTNSYDKYGNLLGFTYLKGSGDSYGTTYEYDM